MTNIISLFYSALLISLLLLIIIYSYRTKKVYTSLNKSKSFEENITNSLEVWAEENSYGRTYWVNQ